MLYCDNKKRTLDVTIEPIGYGAEIEGEEYGKTFLMDLHFRDVVSVYLDYSDYGYIHEM